MTPSDFDRLRRLLKQGSGLDLSIDKRHLVESRLMPLARRTGFDHLDQLLRAVFAGDTQLIAAVVESMTTNETSFFRDRTPFDHLRDVVLPALLQSRAARRSLRIWSAACSSGQEPYSIAMCLKEFGTRLDGWHVEIVATDISSAMMRRSEQAVFSQFEVQRGLPIHLLLKYFTPVGEADLVQTWQVNPEIRAMVTHRPFNLLHDVTPLGTFDVIFCRNVLACFDETTRAGVLSRLSQALQTDGYLMLDGAETVRPAFAPHPDRRGLYRRDLRASPPAHGARPFKIVA